MTEARCDCTPVLRTTSTSTLSAALCVIMD